MRVSSGSRAAAIKRDVRNSQPIPPAPTNKTLVFDNCVNNSSPKIALACALRALAVDMIYRNRRALKKILGHKRAVEIRGGGF